MNSGTVFAISRRARRSSFIGCVSRTCHRFSTNTKEFSNLPRKYKISISGCPIHCHQPDINCVGLFGLLSTQGDAGFGVKVGGGLSSAPHLAKILPVWISPEQAWPVTKAISEIFRDE